MKLLKKYVLPLLLVFFASFLSAQTSGLSFEFIVKSPASIAGSYGYAGTQDFGPGLDSDLCGQLVWAENGAETLGCEPLTESTDLTNKIALIRRGACDFSLKIYHAQEKGAKAVIIVNHNESGDPDELVGMLGGDSSSVIEIPAIFVSYNTGLSIIPALEEGGQVEVCFELPTFNFDFGPYAYFTPQSQVVPMENMSVRITNRGLQDLTDAVATLQITDPNGVMEELTATNNVGVGEEVDFIFPAYIPEAVGEYSMKYISGIDAKEIERNFEITEYTWGMDNGNIENSIGPSPEQFAEASFFYQHGNLILAGASGIATHVSFGLGNGEDLFSGDPSADLILLAIYNADKDGDQEIDDFSTFDELGDPLEIGFYEIQGDETIDELITVPMDSPVMLEEGGIYYISIAYDGLSSGLGIGPSFAASREVQYLNFPSTPLQLDQLYSGWANWTLVTRLHLEGFVSSTVDLELLEDENFYIVENPISKGKLNYVLQLKDVSESIQLFLRNMEGKVIESQKYSSRNFLQEQFNTEFLPPGTYFLNVITDEGFASRKVIIQ